jgi:FkbM family methyltransferase
MNVKRRLLAWMKEAARAAGLDVRRLHSASSPGCQLHLALQHFGIDLVLDVGANTGQFGAELRSHGFGGAIVSFEPLSAAHAALTARAAGDPKWRIHPRVAIGDTDGTVEINVSGNLFSSSILPMLDAHTAAANESAYVALETVPISRLDAVAGPYLHDCAAPFLKIDTQGFEKHVLDGARATLPRLRGVLSEVSLVPLYEGQPLWLEMLARMKAQGFTLWRIQPGFTDPRDGRTLQVDAVWFRL